MNYRFFILVPLLIFTACSRKSNPDANLKLLDAAENSDLKKLDEAIAEGADINFQDTLGNTALHYAAFFHSRYSRHREVVFERLLSIPEINLDLRNKNAQSPILSTESIDAILKLARAGAEVNIKDTSGSTPLHYAAGSCRLDVVAYLSEERDADIHARNNQGQTPLMVTLREFYRPYLIKPYVFCKSGELGSWMDKMREEFIRRQPLKHQIVMYLFNKGAEINVKYKSGETPLHYALKDGNKDIFDFLINNGVSLEDARKTNPYLLQLAAEGQNLDLVEYLLWKGFDPDLPDDYGNSPLYTACSNGNLQLVKLLLPAGSNPDHSKYKKTPLHAAAEGGFADCVQLLLLKGAAINSTNSMNYNALHFLLKPSRYRFKTNSQEIPDYMATLNILLDAGINTNLENKNGDTPLSLYEFNDYRFMSGLRKPKKSSPEPKSTKSDDKTTVFYVNNKSAKDVPIYAEPVDIFQILEKHNTDFSVKNNSGQTLLFTATLYHDIPVAKFLLNHGVEINAMDDQRKTIMDYLDEENPENSSVADFKSYVKSRGALKASQLK